MPFESFLGSQKKNIILFHSILLKFQIAKNQNFCFDGSFLIHPNEKRVFWEYIDQKLDFHLFAKCGFETMKVAAFHIEI